MQIARELSGYDGEVSFRYGRDDEWHAGDTDAWTTWSPLNLWKRPCIKLFPRLFERGFDAIGICLTHELIHCRQGFFKVYWQKFVWAILRRSGYPPVEDEAYESVNLWHDHQPIF